MLGWIDGDILGRATCDGWTGRDKATADSRIELLWSFLKLIVARGFTLAVRLVDVATGAGLVRVETVKLTGALMARRAFCIFKEISRSSRSSRNEVAWFCSSCRTSVIWCNNSRSHAQKAQKIHQLEINKDENWNIFDICIDARANEILNWYMEQLIVNIFAAMATYTQPERLLNIFSFDPLRPLEVINVIGSDAYKTFFLSLNSNFQQNQLRFLPFLADDGRNNEVYICRLEW